MNKSIIALVLSSSLFGCATIESLGDGAHSEKVGIHTENRYRTQLSGHEVIHENLVSVNYIRAVKVLTAKSWIGNKVYKVDDSCFEVRRDIQVKHENVGFSDAINAAAIPEYYEVGTLVEKTKAVGCDAYEVYGERSTTY